MPRFKADLHIHNSFDFLERSLGRYGLLSPFDCIDLAHREGYKVLSFTHHGILFDDKNVTDYARKKDILLIPGIEAFVNRKHVLLYNFPKNEFIDTFEKLMSYKNDENLVIAPHPFYPSQCCLRNDLIDHIDCFDAIEYSHFYTRFFNPNTRILAVSELYKLPIVGFSDTHYFEQFGTTYSLIDADEFSQEAIIYAIKKGTVEVVTRPLPLKKFLKISLWMLYRLRYIYGNFIRQNILSMEQSCSPSK